MSIEYQLLQNENDKIHQKLFKYLSPRESDFARSYTTDHLKKKDDKNRQGRKHI